MKKFTTSQWKATRKRNPYRFPEPVCEDPRFWTNTQLKMWEDFYSSQDPMVCEQEGINMSHYERHREDLLKHIHSTLVKMDIFPLLQIEHTYCPELIAQFYCTLRATNDAVRSMTWMSGTQRVYSSLSEFATILGYTWRTSHGVHGYKLHDENEYDVGILEFCYPPGIEKNMPFNSNMYPFYNLLSKIFRRTIMVKAGDKSAIRAFMVNLMYLSKPNRQKKIDVMDFIFSEICLGALEKRKPAYGPYIQKLINAKCGEQIMENYAIHRPRLFTPSFQYGPDIPELARAKGPAPTPGASGSGGSQQSSSGFAKFFKALFNTCSDSRSLAHDALEMAKETRRIQNADRRAAGTMTEDDPPSLAPKALVPIVMPPICDEDFRFDDEDHDAEGTQDEADDDEDGDDEDEEYDDDGDALA